MAERPDLDAIEADMQIPTFYGSVRAMVKLQSLLTYCRELEAENKRLRDGGKKTTAAILAAAQEARSAREEMEKEWEKHRERHAKWLAAAGDCEP
ncbi:MAG: hypothetical protein ACR2RF_32175 [Geminicoccaceae bacterium]